MILIIFIGILVFYKFEINKESFPINDQTKCELSGGKWDYIACNCPGCQKHFYCNCVIESKSSISVERDLESQLDIFRLREKKNVANKICKPCKNDSDCGQSSCKLEGNGCESQIFKCDKGICKRKRETWGDYISGNVYNCINNQCKLITNF